MAEQNSSWLSARLQELRCIELSATKPKIERRRLAPCSERNYEREHGQWEKFRQELGAEDTDPDIPLVKLFVEWLATTKKGKLDENLTINTLIFKLASFKNMQYRYYSRTISKDLMRDVAGFIRTELKTKFDLQDVIYEKNVATHADIDNLFYTLWNATSFSLRWQRTRVQLGGFKGLIAGSAARPGAILRSESYRDTNVALCYKDIEFFLDQPLPSSMSPNIRMKVTFNNMKGARLDDKKFIVLTLISSSDLHSCPVLMFLALAFLDNAFQEINEPKDLDRLFIPPNRTSLPLPFRDSMMDIPIMRRMSPDRSKISDTLAWSTGSAMNLLHKLGLHAGYPQRLTPYNIRRGVSNELNGKISIAQQNQIMGHGSSTVFERHYLSKQSTVDVSCIFKGQATRIDSTALSSMAIERDSDAPTKLPPRLEKEIHEDKKIKSILKCRENFKEQLELAVGVDKTAIRAEISRLSQEYYTRLELLRRHRRKSYRREWFETQANTIIRSQKQASGGENKPDELWSAPSTVETLPRDRLAVVEALYPTPGKEWKPSMTVAIERILDMCRNDTHNRKMRSRKPQAISSTSSISDNTSYRELKCEDSSRDSTGHREHTFISVYGNSH